MFDHNHNQSLLPFGEGEPSKKPKINNTIRFFRGLGNWSELAIATTSSELFALFARLFPAMQPVYWIVSGGIAVVLAGRFVGSQGKQQSQASRLFVGIVVGATLGWADAVGQLVSYYWEEFLVAIVVAIAALILVIGVVVRYQTHKRKQQANIFGGYQP